MKYYMVFKKNEVYLVYFDLEGSASCIVKWKKLNNTVLFLYGYAYILHVWYMYIFKYKKNV